MKAISSLTRMSKDRIALSVITDNMQSLTFLTRIEFLELMAHMFDYRDAHKDEFQEAVQQLQNG